ncbi:MAG: cyclic nucleotide-binding domain-containing protein [Chlamydiales bacterium]|nr:cyclic nucleotide-binding domain-containing protein [Chlamydiales bacterium]
MESSSKLLHFLKSSKLFRSLSDEELSLLIPLIEVQVFEKGSWIIQEGKPGEHLFLIKSGQAEILKGEAANKEHPRLALIGPGEWFGEMAFFEAEGRSASVRAVEKIELVTLSLSELKSLKVGEVASAKIALNLSQRLSSRLRETNETLLRSLKQEIKLTQSHEQIGNLIIHLFILLTFYFFIFKALDRYGADTITTATVTPILMLGFAVSSIFIIKKAKYPLEFYGITLKNWKRNVFEGVVFTLPLLLGILLLKWYLIHFVQGFEKVSLFEFGPEKQTYLYFFDRHTPEKHFFIFSLLYLLFVPLQEFLSRGCLQSCFQNFFHGPRSTLLAILTSNLLFGMFHSHNTLSLALVAMCFGVFWGWLYARQKSLVGPIISHILVGGWAFTILNFEHILT